MTKPSAANERIKRDHVRCLREARGRDAATVDAVAKSLARFEVSTRHREFRRLHREQAVAFKTELAQDLNARTGEPLSKSTVLATLRHLREFFLWLAREPGFRQHIADADADYFNLPDTDVAVARARREKRAPRLEQVRQVLARTPTATMLERRDRALIAVLTLTGARIGALASFRLGRVDLAGGFVEQDARTVQAKAAKSFRTCFMPVDDGALGIAVDWMRERERDHLWGRDDPLFPATDMGLDAGGGLAPLSPARRGWVTADRVREIVRRALATAGLPSRNPPGFRDMLMRYAMALDLTPEDRKARSQNLGHADVPTTFTSYGQVPTHRQGETIRRLRERSALPLAASREEVGVLERVLARARAR